MLVINDRRVTAVAKLSIDIPQEKREQQPLQRLEQLATDRDRSMNDLACQALAQFVAREEQTDSQG